MRWLPSHSIRHKLVGIVLLTTLAALLVALLAMVAYDLRSYHRAWIADVTTQAELLGQTSASALAFDDATVAGENLALLRLRPRVQAAAIYDARGTRFATYARDAGDVRAPALPEPDGVRIDGADMVLFRRIVSNGEIAGTVYLRTDYEFYGRLRDLVGITALVTLMAMGVALLVSAQLQRIVSGPVLAIERIARAMVDSDDYSRRAEKLGNDEVGQLADSFNRMLDEIQRRSSALQVANDELARQNAERERAETEVLRLNAQLEQRVRDRTAQLEVANQELEAFAYSVSHDLRAPLRAIDGFSQALVEDFPDDVPVEAQRYLQRIRAGTLRMGQLIEDLLNLSRFSRGALERVDVDVAAMASQIVAELRQHDPARVVDVSLWDGITANADPRLLRAALENLIGNAWKFTAKSAAARIEVGALRDAGRHVYFVRDNGAGFEMKFADKLFQAFQRLHGATEYSGTGIGLATVQRIVHRHGGRIWADAQVGKGATFYFTLEPADAVASANAAALPDPASSIQPR